MTSVRLGEMLLFSQATEIINDDDNGGGGGDDGGDDVSEAISLGALHVLSRLWAEHCMRIIISFAPHSSLGRSICHHHLCL